jgi:F-type H+-transporting ATPase subunit b
MHAFTLLAEASGGGAVGEIARTFGVDWSHLIAQILSFAIVCILLQRYAYRPVLEMLEERRRRIAEGLAQADTIKVELARTEAQRLEVLTQANVQAAKLIDEARAAAALLRQQETDKATAAAEQIVLKARETTRQEHNRMLAELKGEVGRLVVGTTAAVVGKVLTLEDQQRLAEETARQFAA